MKRLLLVTLVLSACAVRSTTSAGPPPPPPPAPQPEQPPPPPPPPPPQQAFDSTGWTLLGSQTVDGHRDRDSIVVGKHEGKFDQLTLVVVDSDLELNDFLITFHNNQTFQPNVRHTFREGSRSRVIDLPGNDRFIKRIDLRYANIPGGGKARVEVWGRNVKNAPPPPPGPRPPSGPAWDSTGWTMLGSQTVSGHGGKADKDVIHVGKHEGRYDELTMVVTDSDLELVDFVVTFGNNETFRPNVKHTFREGARTRAIDLPGNTRTIKKIETYANLPGGGKARVELWGRQRAGGGGGGAAPPAPVFDSKGWTLLGSQTVSGRGGKADKDVIVVGKQEGRFDQLTMVVTDSDLDLLDLVVTFGNNTTFQPKVKHVFKEGARSRVIDLPGNDRFIKQIELTYTNLPGGGKARVEVWGRNVGKKR